MENFNAKYVNPLSDWGFKRLFGTEMNKDLLLAQEPFPGAGHQRYRVPQERAAKPQ